MTPRSGCFRLDIEVLYFEDCPNYLPTINRVNAILREEGCDANIREVLVPDRDSAQQFGFLGSPTVRVNGIDIEPAVVGKQDFGLMCRRYLGGVPSQELIRTAIRSALEAGGGEQ